MMPTSDKTTRFSLPRRLRVRRLPGLVAWLVASLAQVYRRTLRLRISDPHGFLHSGLSQPGVVALWHNRIPLSALCFPLEMRRRAAVLVSASRDGEYAAAVVARFGMRTVRGSSSRRGAQAFRELAEEVRQGALVVLTLDGPRGPRYEPHAGAVALAASCGVPLVPISLNAPRRGELRSWDRTQFPLPFSRVDMVVGQPLRLERGDEAAVARVRQALLEITDDRRQGQSPAGPSLP
jgi:lysophospholipid acyltransferase (LPLAT)-like uncharacterized protein